MMQALLVERFKLAVHEEERTLPVCALLLVKPGTQLRPHPDVGMCSDVAGRRLESAPGKVNATVCNQLVTRDVGQTRLRSATSVWL